MSSSAIKYPKRLFSQTGGDASLPARVITLENNEYKITYFAEISSSTGTITIPTGATILLDQFQGGIDAYVCTIQNGQPTGNFPQTSLGVTVDVASFNALGNFTLSGTPSSYPVALIYILKIKAKDYYNLDITKILDLEDINIEGQLALKADKSNTTLSTYLEIPEQSKPGTPTNAARIYVDSSNRLSWIGENGYVRTFDGTANTADRVYTLPNYNFAIKDSVSVYFVIGGLSPADSTTYYSTRLAPTTTASSHAIKFSYNGIIRGATIVASGNTIQGSAENNTWNFRNVTQGTSSLLSNSVKSNATTTNIVSTTVSGLNISFLSTDDVCLEWITPAYATNPTGVSWYIYLDIEKTS